ncbi:MAG: hypothetical protein V1871_09805 [Planctomycetota bacterium]
MKKPVLVIIIAVVWIYMGINIFLRGIGLLAAHDVVQSMLNNLEALKSGDDIPYQLDKVLGIIIKHPTLMGIIQMAIGLFLMVSAFYLFRLRAWARTALEITAWFGLTLVSVYGVFIIFLWKVSQPMFEELSIGGEIPEFSYMYNTLIYMSVFSAIAIIAVILMIIFLRGKTIRNAVKSSSTVNQETTN